MLPRLSSTLLLRPADVPPSQPDLEVIGVFNPAAIHWLGEVNLLARVVERPLEKRTGWLGLPRWDQSRVIIDWTPESDVDWVDQRVVRLRSSGLARLTFTSHLVPVHCGDGRAVHSMDHGRFLPVGPMEEYGVEDPRLTVLDDRCWFTYVVVSRHGACTALASTRDFKEVERHGVILPPENKDVTLFPEKIGGQYVALHRPVNATPFSRPEMWLARSPDLLHWGQHEFLYAGTQDWENGRVGAGPPPIKTAAGWLVLYHGNRRPTGPGDIGVYCAGALLLDLENPAKILAWSRQPLLEPATDFEKSGFVPGVIFPTGIVVEGERIWVYYGAADECCAVVKLTRMDILSSLTPWP